jgi:hypothetical protein
MKNIAHWLLLSLAITICASAAENSPLWRDPGFEALNAGLLEVSGTPGDWEIQKTGRTAIQPKLTVEGVADSSRAHAGQRCVSLTIPADTQGFEFVTVGQRIQLAAGKLYEASVWVRWPEGPDSAPKGASSTSGHPSAIVSFWARHRDGMGDFAGRDEWLFDNQWKKLTFSFHTTDPEQRSLIYVSLLPNQKPVATTVLVDDFTLTEAIATAEQESRSGSIVKDSDFQAQQGEQLSPPWFFANIGGTGIRGLVASEGENRHVRLAMGKQTTNFESAQLWQHLALQKGCRYQVSCRIRWDNFSATAPAPIVNYGIYHEATRTWYGPVDQVLEKSGEWRNYPFTHIPPLPGPWKLYIQLNGWGNFGEGVTVSVDDLDCRSVARP